MPFASYAQSGTEHGRSGDALVDAVRSGDARRVRAALERGGDPNAADASRWTALAYAAMGGEAEIAELLIAAGADVNARTQDGSTPLMAAAVMGHTSIARSLLAGGADPTLRNDSGADARSKAQEYGHAEMVALLDAAMQSPPLAASPSSTPQQSGSMASARAVSPDEGAAAGPLDAASASESSESHGSSESQTSAPSDASAGPAPEKAAAQEAPRRLPRNQPIEAHFWVLRDSVVRADASPRAERIDVLSAGTRVFVTRQVRDWYEVEYDDRSGFIYEKLLERATEIESPAPRELGPNGEAVSPLVLASGRWATPGNPAMCRRDFLEVRFVDERMSLIVYAAGERTVLARDLPVVEMRQGRIEASEGGLVWRFEVTPNELRYRVGSANEVRYVRCPDR